MQSIRLSINPTYFCNFRCKFCYLSNEQLSTAKFIDSDAFFKKLEAIACHRNIEHVDLYGGEISTIPPEKLKEIFQITRSFFSGPINVITNYSLTNQFLENEDITLSISWDYTARERHMQIYNRMLQLKKTFSILVLASKELISMPDDQLDQMIEMLNQLPHLQSVEIKPFSDNNYHTQSVSFQDFEKWIMKWIARSPRFKFNFVNEANIKKSIARTYSAWSDDHLYITPNGRFAVLEFDDNSKEYFLEFDEFDFYEEWVNKERNKVTTNAFCSSCEYLGHCLSEHLQDVKSLSQSCNGFKGLLDWYSLK